MRTLQIKLSRVNALIRRGLTNVGYYSARHLEPYATHLPVLIGIGRLTCAKTVLELGCGQHSTLGFLDTGAFPLLERLDSFEDDPLWSAEVQRLTNDPRLTLGLVDCVGPDTVRDLDTERYDLVFIDNSTHSSGRADTIRALASMRRAIVVIHDFEVQPYREASLSFTKRYAFTALNPQTGVCWSGSRPKRSDLRRLNALIRRNRKIPPSDIRAWVELVSAAFPE